MIRNRYHLTAEFNDEDFDLGWRGRYFMNRRVAVRQYYIAEYERMYVKKEFSWHCVLRDRKTGAILKPQPRLPFRDVLA